MAKRQHSLLLKDSRGSRTKVGTGEGIERQKVKNERRAVGVAWVTGRHKPPFLLVSLSPNRNPDETITAPIGI